MPTYMLDHGRLAELGSNLYVMAGSLGGGTV